MTLVHMLHTLADVHDRAGRPTTSDALREAAGRITELENALAEARDFMNAEIRGRRTGRGTLVQTFRGAVTRADGLLAETEYGA